MPPHWLYLLSIIALIAAFASAVVIALDLRRHRQKMGVMNAVWPVTALYFGPFAIWAYWTMGRQAGTNHKDKPFWMTTFVGATHCGAGCTLGDIIAEFMVFFTGLAIAGSSFGAELVGDYILAFSLGIAFQYFAIVPMRNLSPGQGIIAALKADALSLTSFEIGLFGWMALMRFVFFHPALYPNSPVFWFMMQIGMIVGFATTFPVNWWLVKAGIKEAM
ncbi:DUF4396 domain-containing protein [Acidiphilium sp. PA]|uniref:DUF4396 domain-containing protein n=1 Tax=Acidiphilium sp. PA TaxID=2871705 RepID=UPI002243F921|nr:DUF4396 domain-containing protein [Acidiphilium sp. PA]MCW8309476.1 DUF4396 domain-containing protein [Acidiphilium sp. PA]